MKSNNIKVVLVGNPNTGKTSLFNRLTGLNQKVGNYPGVTVDKKQGTCKLPYNKTALITDLPGIYSINPTSLDESIVLNTLMNGKQNELIDIIVVVAEVENLKRNLLLFSQIQDLGIPIVLAINMTDQMNKKGISINIKALEEQLQARIVLISVRTNSGINTLKNVIANFSNLKIQTGFNSIINKIDIEYFLSLKKISKRFSVYHLWLMLTQNYSAILSLKEKELLKEFKQDLSTQKKYQHKETIYRYQKINKVLQNTYKIDKTKASDLRSKLDRVFTHKIFGYLIFFGLLLLIFQSIFHWAAVPMDFIDNLFTKLSEYSSNTLSEGMLSKLLSEGVIPGIGGVVIFIPQIALLFLFISILEETGYMSRVVFLMDKIMRRFGMSGKSIIPLISGTACAIPAVIATRTIASWKERLITILVTPFITCQARLPVYAIIIALVIPNKKVLGILDLQGLTLFGLYILGFTAAISAAYILNKSLKIKTKTLFVVEIPNYKLPLIKNIIVDVFEKTKTFVLSAGKIILAISIVMWFLASNGPSSYKQVERELSERFASNNLSEKELKKEVASAKLEKSYIGIIGKSIEPLVKPLGYDWKIGIALISSFAAREVFVGTLAIIYSVESSDEDTTTIKQRMDLEINQNTGKKQFDLATGISLLLFYTFAMQCMATLATVKRETKSWKWPMVQLFGMGIIAYVFALFSYQILS
ncbi:MAG: ferrous iron transport protein B [Tenacibaculum sp.]